MAQPGEPGFRAAPTVDDDAQGIGNSPGDDGRGRLHTKVANTEDEPIPVLFSGIVVAANTHLTRLRMLNAALYRISDGQMVRTTFGTALNITIVDGGKVLVKLE